MKRFSFTLGILAVLALLIVGSFVFAGPVEERVLGEQILGVSGHGHTLSEGNPFPEGVRVHERYHLRWPISHAKTKWSYAFLHEEKVDEGGPLLTAYREQSSSALDAAGAEVQSELEGGSSDSPLGFRIRYQKSRVSGEISVDCSLNPYGSFFFEVTQVEEQ